MPANKSPLRVLSDIISNAVTKVDEQYAAANLEFPSLEETFDPKDPANTLLSNFDVTQNISLVVAAAEQLVASIRHPNWTTWDAALMHVRMACLQTAIVGGIPEILREAGPEGLHVRDISAKNGIDAMKIARVLRLLAVTHIFTEVKVNVFANNRISSVLDTKKPSSEVMPRYPPNPNKFTQTDGLAALIEYITEDLVKGASSITEVLVNPKTRDSNEPTDAPYAHAFNTTDSYFTWLNRPENEYRRIRFDMAMHGLQQAEPKEAVLRGFPWDSLADGSKVVDVGGGVGGVSLLVAKQFPSLKFVIQDTFIDGTEQFWNEHIPGSVSSGTVVAQKHDFFDPQPVKDADLFLVRAVVHNWPNAYASKILKHLRNASVPGKTKLLVIDHIVQYACRDVPVEGSDIPGAALPPVPEPLLPNVGIRTPYSLDLNMLIILQGQERTLGDQVQLFTGAGWKITRIYSPPGSGYRHLLAEAI